VQLGQLATTLREISAEFPKDIDWILRVDGHTDRRPINTFQFASNWELSAARAISVVKFLISRGIPAERLTAAGFAADRRGQRRSRLQPQPTHRVQADAKVSGGATRASFRRFGGSRPEDAFNRVVRKCRLEFGKRP
jgi:hypothetical protein